MAHARTINKDARLISQLATGKYTRYVKFKPIIVALNRTVVGAGTHILANLIDGEVSCNIPIFTAPCACKVTRVFANAKTYPTTSGAATIQAKKAVIGGADVALNTAIDIDDPTDETAIDGVLSATAGALDLIEGQLVYALVALSATTSARSDGLIVGVEWYPTDTSYAGS